MAHHRFRLEDLPLTRRDMLRRSGMGFGMLGLAGLLASEGWFGNQAQAASSNPMLPRAPHFPGRAKRVIHLFMNGGPSHVDTFDPKPMLDKYDGKPLPITHLRTERKTGGAFRSPFRFHKYGKSGIEVSDIFPHVGACIDDICVIR
ncbi:MAG TPA: DUF1501 domain-containing protein, partial [Gemmataceae bacterium]|nr:DUF1501 domain-containing protein [Gemmataceae bacterium]